MYTPGCSSDNDKVFIPFLSNRVLIRLPFISVICKIKRRLVLIFIVTSSANTGLGKIFISLFHALTAGTAVTVRLIAAEGGLVHPFTEVTTV